MREPGQAAPEAQKSSKLTWLGWIAALAVLGWFAASTLRSDAPAPPTISYSSFVDQVRAGHVAAVTLTDHHIDGTFTDSLSVADGRVIVPDQSRPAARSSDDASSVHFETTIPQGSESIVLSLLETHGVTIEAKVADGAASGLPNLWLLVIMLLPIVLIVGLLIFGSRMLRSDRVQQDALRFGRAQPRRHDPSRPQVRFTEVAGEDEAKEHLIQVVDFLRRPDYYRRLGAHPPRGILLVGPPGTGKTLMAKAVAGEAGVAFFSISASEFVEMFVGVGASRVRDLFAQAKSAAPAILFVDEIDAVGRQRGVGIGGGNDEREHTLNQLLVELDGFEEHEEVVVLAATNRPDVLDPALLRPGRFDRQVELNLPDRKGREAILEVHARNVILAPDVNIANIAAATPGFAGADLANLINEAALLAARARKPCVEQSDLEAALDRIVLGTERPILIGERERCILAYHEAGHALIAALTPGADPLRKVSIVPRGRALGVTVQAPIEDRFTYTSGELRARLAILLGGRAAEQLVFDESTTGAENDLKEATALARSMVGRWGMSKNVGAVFLGLGEEHPFLGRELAQPSQVGEAALDRAQGAVRELVDEALAAALAMLTEHRIELDRVAKALVHKETLERTEIEALISAPIPVSSPPATSSEPAPTQPSEPVPVPAP
jgi:cell division protease FtsH